MGHTAIAEQLIENGAEVNVKDKDGATPLHAARKGCRNIFEVLKGHGAKTRARR